MPTETQTVPTGLPPIPVPSEERAAARTGVLQTINNPLGFYVLGLLIVEGFLGAALLRTSETPAHYMTCVWIGAGMFTLVTVLATGLVWWRAKQFVFTRTEYIEELKALSAKQSEMQREIEDVKAKVDLERKVESIVRDGRFFWYNKKPELAVASFADALALQPRSDEIRISLAVAKSDLPNGAGINESLKILDEIILRRPQDDEVVAKALFNRACIRSLPPSQFVKPDWLADLRTSIRLHDRYRARAKEDSDFDSFKNDPDFLAVLAGN